VTEQVLLAIIETLKYFRYMLLGHQIIIKTDNKNLTHPLSTHTSSRVLRQWLLLEEYGADLEYVQGSSNVVADALSRLPTNAETASNNDSAEKNELVADAVAASETERTAAKMSDLVSLLSSLPTEELFVFHENDFPLKF
jgi:cysteinyl-tRNA synthetase